MQPLAVVRVSVPAKVNLHLGVGALRPDGFHELCTVFHAVDLTDVVTVRAAERTSLIVRGEGAAELPRDSTNLAWRAAQLLAERAGVRAAVAIELDKSIPVAGGMAGGSADAAATLLACAQLWQLSTADLPAIAAELGSDVAFPLLGATALGTGRGELLESVPSGDELHWAFALADYGVSAGAAYRELEEMRLLGDVGQPSTARPAALLAALRDADPDRVAALLHNDLQAAVLRLRPELDAVLRRGVRAGGALASIVSGSGPTCAFLCSDARASERVADQLRPTVRAVVTARGPAPGATVLIAPLPDGPRPLPAS